MTQLRQYQLDGVDNSRAAMRTHNCVLTVAPTGAGKTVLGAHIIASALAKGKRSLFFAHRRELIHQTRAKLMAYGVPASAIGILMGKDPLANAAAPIQIASIDTWRNRQPPPADLVLIDEAHRAMSPTYARAREHYLAQGAKILGLTATPWLINGDGLGAAFGALVVVAKVSELIAEGFLVAPRVFRPPLDMRADLSEVRISHGDFIEADLHAAMNKRALVGGIVEHWQKRAEGRRTVVFAAGVEHSQQIAAMFNEAGIPAGHIDGETPAAQRDATLARLESGELRVVSNCGVLCEGWDMPSVKCAVLARPTQSLVLHLQQCGRILRPWEGVGALILDHAGNTMRHCLPQDDQEYSLAARPKKKKGLGEGPTKECPACFAVVGLSVAECPECGHAWPLKPRGALETEAGELEEVVTVPVAEMLAWWSTALVQYAEMNETRAIIGQRPLKPGTIYHRFVERFKRRPPPGCRLPTEQGSEEEKQQAWHALQDRARERGYKSGWAYYQFRERFGHPPPRG